MLTFERNLDFDDLRLDDLEFDVESTHRRFGGDDELLAEVLRTSIEELPPMAERLEQVRQSKDLRLLGETAHWIKGALSLISARRSVDVAARLEKAPADRADALALELHRRMQRLVEQARRVLELLAL